MAQRNKAFLVIVSVGAALLLCLSLFKTAPPIRRDSPLITKIGVPAEPGDPAGTTSTKSHEETEISLPKEAVAAELRPIEEWLHEREQERTKIVQRIESEFIKSVFVRVDPPDSREVAEAYGQLETRLKRFGAKSA